MRKPIVALLALLMVLCFSLPAMAAQVYVDGERLDVSTANENGTTLVPLRAIFQSLGASVDWDGSTQTITASKDGTTVKLQIGSKTAYKNDQAVNLQVPGRIINGNTMVPLRFVSESLGANVVWDAATRTITITSTSDTFVEQVQKHIYTVARVIDGDTIEINMNGKTEKVRLIGVDTPETVHPTKGEQPYGKQASNFTKSRLEGKQVQLEFDVQERDQYGRLLAYVWIGGQMFNEILVKEGYAQVATYPPNVKYVDRFTAAQKEAREAGRGLWGLGSQTSKQPSATTGKYVGSKESDKYHLPTCRWVEKIKADNQVWFKDADDAKAKGYVPCGVCKP